MNFALKTEQTQTKLDCESVLQSIEHHVQTAARYLDFDDTRYFTMRDASEVSVNLFLALELLDMLKRQGEQK